ncbi:hypothetical protein ACOQFV_24145 [Nocardiopsis changdeensis]|uniref:Uncharacterized protein n=1 Tax=Nocardiopsis changdeensis TaxID=2831969 RepID=A0A975QCB8_9ACTN|nr:MULTISPECIES: hypothetical protein [Nocardiopsis]QUX26514.1 hypothetical protein KGD84_32980 [Nocardiopsis changdeensis]QYX40786.1 hypothetical protein K1J57_32830 [Nocardiopsis sp. MT53]
MTSDNDAPTMLISCGSGGAAWPEQTRPRTGRPRRETWYADQAPEGFAADQVPGGHTTSSGLISGIVVPVDVQERYYAEDGLSLGVGADEGYVWTVTVRPAAAEEAAPLVEAEQRRGRQAHVAARLVHLLDWRYGGRQPDAFHYDGDTGSSPATAVPVPMAPRYDTAGLHRELLIDRRSGVLWTLAYNGGDGDDWTQSTWGSWIAIGHPLTPDRERLVQDLTDLYADDDDWRHQGVAADGQRALLEAGWTLPALRQRLQTMQVVDAADVAALLERTPQEWKEAGWPWQWPHGGYQLRGHWRVTEAAALAAAGMDYPRAKALREHGGHTTVAATLAARPPHVPEGTRVKLTHPNPRYPEDTAPVWAGSAEEMRTYLEHNADRWDWLVSAETGPRAVHHEGGGDQGWTLWDDHSITRGAWVICPIGHGFTRPRDLTAPARAAVELFVAADRIGRSEQWVPLLEAVEHDRTPMRDAVLNRAAPSPFGDGCMAQVTEHRFLVRRGDGTEHTVTWWEATTARGDCEGDIWDKATTLHTSGAEARSEALERLGQLRAEAGV